MTVVVFHYYRFSQGAINTAKASAFPLVCCHLISHDKHMLDEVPDQGVTECSEPHSRTYIDSVKYPEGVSDGTWRRKDPFLLVGTDMLELSRSSRSKVDRSMKTESDPGRTIDGRILSFIANEQAQKMFPGVSIATICKGTFPHVTLLYRTPVDSSVVLNIGAVTRRLSSSGRPMEWARWTG